MNRIIITLALAAVSPFATAAEVKAIDGDTIIVSGEHIRLVNIDTPEIRHAQCDAEKRLGMVAKRRMGQLISAGAPVLVRGDHGRMVDRYGRSLARVLVDGRDVGEILVAEGLARSWDGARHSWCK